MLKLASLGMFSFSLGQTVLCLGRNQTSCESYGYNACDYQVAAASVRACPSRPPAKPHLFHPLVPWWEAVGRAALPAATSRGRHTLH